MFLKAEVPKFLALPHDQEVQNLGLYENSDTMSVLFPQATWTFQTAKCPTLSALKGFKGAETR